MILQTKIALIVFCITLSAFFSGSEIALFSFSNLRVKYLVKTKVRKAKLVENLKSKPQKLLITILIGNNIANVAASALATSITFDFIKSYAVSIAIGAMTLIILIFGEIVPKTLASRHNEKISLAVARSLQIIQKAFFPFVFVLNQLVNFLTKGNKKRPLITEEELLAFVSFAEEIGEIKKGERKMIQRIFRFNDLEAKDVMTPRNKMICVPDHSEMGSLVLLFEKERHRFLPVYKKNLGQIVGLVDLVDVQSALARGKKLPDIIKPILFVPDNKKLDLLLRLFKHKKIYLAIVQDKYKTNIGLITLEDILEEIVGEIISEHELFKRRFKKFKKIKKSQKNRKSI